MSRFTKMNNFENQSEYYKYRTLICLAHVDGRLMKEEREFLESHITEHASENIQGRLLEEFTDDIFNPQTPEDLYGYITEPEDRIDLLRMAFKLFIADGHVDKREQKSFDFIKKEILENPETMEILRLAPYNWDAANVEESLKKFLLST